ncbi:hypothetical protein [Anaerosoma tenue]|uniref:hypothetical protein n=1 Tax=Anaerosoma tenue TaxID=2933588 RepID=UPI0022608CBD|nr:hypothetical protein [Anaerosoma tenue]MCK8114811.1 hypothetical protein [Anaerosoma tenue]
MKTRSMIVVLVAVLIVGLLAMGGCSAPAEEPADGGQDATESPATSEDDVVAEGEQVADSVCLECHSEMAFTAAFVGGPQEGLDWDMVVQRMEESHQVVLTDDEANAVVQYLASREPSEAETLIAEKCTDCHSLEKVYQAENGTSWLDVVSRMQESHGLELTSEEQEAILDFLEQ